MRPAPVSVTGPGKHGTRRPDAARYQGCGDLRRRCSAVRWPRRSPEREGPVEQIVGALSRDAAPVTGKWPRSATISWWTSALAGGVFRIPHTNLAAHRPETRAEPTSHAPAFWCAYRPVRDAVAAGPHGGVADYSGGIARATGRGGR